MKQLFNNTISLLQPAEKRQLIFLIVKEVLINVADVLSLALLLFLITFYTGSGTGPVAFFDPLWMKENMYLILGVFFLLLCIKNRLGYLQHKANYTFVYAVASRLSQKNILLYLNGDYSEFVNTDTAVHIRKISQQPVEFAHYVLAGVQQVITQSLLIMITVAAVLVYNATLFLLLLLILLPPALGLAALIRKKTRAARQHAKTSGEKTLQYLKEALHGYVESAVYDRKNFFAERYAQRQQELNQYLSNLQSVQGMPGRLIELFAILGLFVLIVISTSSGNTNAVPVLTIGAFMAAAYKIMPGIVKILNSSSQAKAYEFTLTGLLADKSNGSVTEDHSGPPAIHSIEYRNVHFSYPGKSILRGLNCVIKAGDLVGIPGLSGSGKTTFINLLLGFIEPDKGDIFLNGAVMDAVMRRQYRKDISYVKQEHFLIHDTILHNITLQEKTYDAERLNSILKATGLDALIAAYPEGINKLVTENGRNLSGGQRQRITIARALYKDAGVILLDEPFNELDKASEALLLQHFHHLTRQGKTVLLITHNKENFSLCNNIISIYEA